MKIGKNDSILSEVNQLLRSKQYPQALKLLNQAIEDDPKNPELLCLRGEVNLAWESNDDAENDLRAASKIAPDMARPYLLLGNLYKNVGEHQKANTEFLRAQHIEPNNVDVQISLLTLRVKTGDFESGLAELERLHKQHPDNENLANSLAFAYSEMGFKDWHTEIEEGVRHSYAMKLGHIKTAQVFLKKVTSLSPQTDEVKASAQELTEFIGRSSKRTFTGGWSAGILPIIVILIGLSTGGFWGWLYALSAAGFYYANWRPVYVSNYNQYHNKSDRSSVDKAMSIFQGDWGFWGSSITNVLFQKAQFMIVVQLIRTSLSCLFMPLSTFSALFSNRDLKKAALLGLVGIIASSVMGGINDAQEEYKAQSTQAFYTAAREGDLDKLDELLTNARSVSDRLLSSFIRDSVIHDHPDAFQLLLDSYERTLTEKQGIHYLNMAKKNSAAKMIEYLSSFQPVIEKTAPTNAAVATPATN